MRQHGKLGRKPGRSLPEGTLQLENYLTAPLPLWDGVDDFTSDVKAWGMLGNDYYGDCGFAGKVHLDMANSWTAQEQPAGNIANANVWPTYNQVVTAYFTYEGSPRPDDPAWNEENGYDNGVDLGEVLKYWMEHPLAGLKPIGGYAQFNVDNGPLFQSCVHAFGGIYAGVLISPEAMQEFDDEQPWTSTATDWEGGHCIPVLARNSLYGKAITWGSVQEFSWEWWRTCREEAFVVFTPEQMEAPGGIFNGVNVAQLKADLAAVAASPVPVPQQD